MTVQRTVDAATAPPITTTAPNSPFNWRPAGTEQLPEGDDSTAGHFDKAAAQASAPVNAFGSAVRHQPTLQEPAMTSERKPRPTKQASTSFQICALLMAKGDLTLDELKADVSADPKQMSNALFNSKAAGRIVFIAKTDKWHITQQGREWTTGGANLANQKAAAEPARPAKPVRERRKPKAKRATPKALKLVKGGPTPTPTPSRDVANDFDFSISTSGRIRIHKAGQQLELTREETRVAMHYLDRMASDAVAA